MDWAETFKIANDVTTSLLTGGALGFSIHTYRRFNKLDRSYRAFLKSLRTMAVVGAPPGFNLYPLMLEPGPGFEFGDEHMNIGAPTHPTPADLEPVQQGAGPAPDLGPNVVKFPPTKPTTNQPKGKPL